MQPGERYQSMLGGLGTKRVPMVRKRWKGMVRYDCKCCKIKFLVSFGIILK